MLSLQTKTMFYHRHLGNQVQNLQKKSRRNKVIAIIFVASTAVVGQFIIIQTLPLRPQLLSHHSNNYNHSSHTVIDKEEKINNDGCGLTVGNNHVPPVWQEWTTDEEEENKLAEVSKCLVRIGWSKLVSGNIEKKNLNCSIIMTREKLKSTLSRHKKIWLHGDSVMEQQFYTLACMMNNSVIVPSEKDLYDERQLHWQIGLGLTKGIERFTYSHDHSQNDKGGYTNTTTTTEITYSRFGPLWGMEDNLYKRDFPEAVQRLGPNDVIFINAAAHYSPNVGQNLERALTFIAQQSIHAKALIYYMEPTPEYWPTTNGLYLQSCVFRCQCEDLAPDRLVGRGNYTQPDRTKDEDVMYVPPDADFFERLYPSRYWENNTDDCVPNCVPATWRSDYARHLFSEHGKNVSHNVHIVPIFSQLIGKGTQSGRGGGDCTHLSTQTAMLINYQWARTILNANRDSNRG